MPEKNARETLLGELIGIARAVDGSEHLIRPATDALVRKVLLAAADPAQDSTRLGNLLQDVAAEKQALVPGCFACASPCGRTAACDMTRLYTEPEAVRKIKLQLLQMLFSAAQNTAFPARALYPPLFAVGMEDVTAEELQPFIKELSAALAAAETLPDTAY